jgi:hypothetical protein
MKYQYLIQKADFFIDEFKDNGTVTLEQAINFFRIYPFKEELMKFQEKEIINRFSKILFKTEDDITLSIWIENNNGYILLYENKKQFAEFFISNDFNENKKGLSVEYFLELFFFQKIEEELNLKNKRIQLKRNIQPIIFTFKNTNKINNLYRSIPWLILSIIIFIYDYNNNFKIGLYVQLIFCLFWLPSFILYLSYWKKNENATVKIDPLEKTIVYEKGGKSVKFNRNEIVKCFINEETSTSVRSNTKSYKYIHFILKDKRAVIITNFITEPENIAKPLNLNCTINDRYISFLPF